MGKKEEIINNDRRTGDLEGIGRVMMPLAKKMLGRRAFAEADIICNWAEIAGEDTAAFSTPRRIDFKKGERTGGVLHIEVAGGAFALELQLRSHQLIDKVNTFFGYEAVQRIKILQNPAFQAKQIIHNPEKKLVTAEEENYIRNLSREVKNPELGDALQRLGLAVVVNNKK